MSDPADPSGWEPQHGGGQQPPSGRGGRPPSGRPPGGPGGDPPLGGGPTSGAPRGGGPPPGAPRPPAWARRGRPGQPPSFAGVRGDPGAWATVGILAAVALTIIADLLLSADRATVNGFRIYNAGTFRAHFLVATGFASVDIALALLLAVGLAAAIRPSAPASFRRTAVAAAGGLAAIIAVLGVLRTLVIATYGHAFGLSGFFGSLATVPIAVAALAISLAVTGRPPS